MNPYRHQIIAAEAASRIMKQYGYVYIFGQPRCGKTLTAILIAEMSTKVESVMVLTKKNAIDGWKKFIHDGLTKKYTVINYEQLGTITGTRVNFKYRPADYQLVIVDESHNYGKFPKPSLRYKILRAFAINMPHIHLSGTPIIESPCSIYHQMNISRYSPFRHPNFYRFHDEFGRKSIKYYGGMQIVEYKEYQPKLLDYIKFFTVNMTQEDAGITEKATDQLHYIELEPATKLFYNDVCRTNIINFGDEQILLDTTLKLRTALHQIEGGALKVGDDYYDLHYREKVNYILDRFGDSELVGIMCHFIGEQKVLKSIFKNAKIYSSNAHAEGVDLSHLEHFIIYSSDYSGAKFVQRRERIINMQGSNTTTVHHLLVKGGVSEQVYNAVSNKLDFNNSLFVASEI